ncbi:hypothetical protein [Dyadobacter fermentans]|uniref:hypothetical protein n=1 Tax=Dyadobacter fermentans TaxID=94254 RepID=UPI001CBC747B|nr:hypothetical protein [Dyadobacter fermentans]
MDKSFSTSQSKSKKTGRSGNAFLLKAIAMPALMVLFCIFFSSVAQAQDKIIQKNGKEIKAKVLGTDSQYIRYKRFDNPTGPDYFLFRSDVLKIEYENGKTETQTEPEKVTQEPARKTPVNTETLERKIAKYQKRSMTFLTAGSVAIVAGAITILKLTGDYNKYKTAVQGTNDSYTTWYQTNYKTAPPAADLQKQESFSAFASPGIYGGAAALIGGLALDLIGLRNMQLAQKARTELASKQKELSWQPFYDASYQTTGLKIALSF